MFTPQDVARHKNLSTSMLNVYQDVHKELAAQTGLTENQFLYKCLGNGFSVRFGCKIYESIHRQLEVAGVPHDIVHSEQSQSGSVTHGRVDPAAWKERWQVKQTAIAAFLLRVSEVETRSGGQPNPRNMYNFTLDSGATATLAWDDQDEYLMNGGMKSHAVVSTAKAGSQFATTSQGILPIAIDTSSSKARKQAPKPIVYSRGVQEIAGKKVLMTLPVVTAPREVLRKQLASEPEMYEKLNLNIDKRRPEEGESCMWKRHPDFPNDLSKRIEIPLRYDAIKKQWTFSYTPIRNTDNLKAMQAIAENTHNALDEIRGIKAVQAQEDLDKLDHEAYMIDLFMNGQKDSVNFHNVGNELKEKYLDKIPADKRLEIVLARHPDERNELGVKQYLHTKEKRSMLSESFHRWYGHVGTGKDCPICRMIRGSMRIMYRVVDKYIETRSGFYWDMDTLTVDVRAYDGTKYYTVLRDRGSKYIKGFNLQFKDHFIDLFDEWLTDMRADKIYEVYNWDFCTVIKADNDGVWMRKSSRWLALIQKHGIRMHYTDKDRKESNSHAERTIGLVETTMKGCMWERGLPPFDHVIAFFAAVWLLNRFPATAALARDSPDGDTIRPLEMLTFGQVSRQSINRQLSAFVLPGTLVWVHDAKAADRPQGQRGHRHITR